MSRPSSRPRPHRHSSRGDHRDPAGDGGPPARGTGESRDERKARTRRALLDAALDLLEHEGFGAISLREVTRAAGVVPTAFYRHFRDMDELGLALVDESIGALHDLLRPLRAGRIPDDDVVASSLAVLREHVRAHPKHFRFLARERSGGSPVLRQTIRREIKLFSSELAVDIAQAPAQAGWPSRDVLMLADLIVMVMVATIEALLEVPPDRPEVEDEVIRLARDQAILILVGAASWQPARG